MHGKRNAQTDGDECAGAQLIRPRKKQTLVGGRVSGSLSPQIRETDAAQVKSAPCKRQRHGMAKLENEYGEYVRQMPKLSGGGFMFDTGAHC
jgi:hypothetical protein